MIGTPSDAAAETTVSCAELPLPFPLPSLVVECVNDDWISLLAEDVSVFTLAIGWFGIES